MDYFATANRVSSNGWARHNASRVAQVFGKVGYTSPQTRLTFSVTGAHNRLSGAQTLPLGMLTDPTQSYTWPDYATHHFAAFNATARHRLSGRAVLAGNLYFRRLLSHELDSNTNDGFNIALPVDGANSPGVNAVAESRATWWPTSMPVTGCPDAGGHSCR